MITILFYGSFFLGPGSLIFGMLLIGFTICSEFEYWYLL